MGQDKGIMHLKGVPLLLYVLNTISGLCDDIIIVLRDKKQVAEYGEILDKKTLKKLDLTLGANLNIHTDLIKDQGPLSGIATGLVYIKSDYALVLPCDSPYITQDFLRKMYEYAQKEKHDIYIPRWSDGHLEPLHAIYHKNSRPVMVKFLSKGIKEVKSIIDHLNRKYIPVEILDKTGNVFKNLNRPEDVS